MPRQSRIEAALALHHVIIRGTERRSIFRDDKDGDAFLDRLGCILLASSTPFYAWSLLSNHGHFLLKTGNIPLSRLMKKLLTNHTFIPPSQPSDPPFLLAPSEYGACNSVRPCPWCPPIGTRYPLYACFSHRITGSPHNARTRVSPRPLAFPFSPSAGSIR
jgi:hypothetical protein